MGEHAWTPRASARERSAKPEVCENVANQRRTTDAPRRRTGSEGYRDKLHATGEWNGKNQGVLVRNNALSDIVQLPSAFSPPDVETRDDSGAVDQGRAGVDPDETDGDEAPVGDADAHDSEIAEDADPSVDLCQESDRSLEPDGSAGSSEVRWGQIREGFRKLDASFARGCFSVGDQLASAKATYERETGTGHGKGKSSRVRTTRVSSKGSLMRRRTTPSESSSP